MILPSILGGQRKSNFKRFSCRSCRVHFVPPSIIARHSQTRPFWQQQVS